MNRLLLETATSLLAATAVVVPSCDSIRHSSDVYNVQCDAGKYGQGMALNGLATFIVHGTGEYTDSTAEVTVRRNNEGVSATVTGDVTGPPQQLDTDGFTSPVTEEPGAEMTLFGAGGAWLLDVDNNWVYIQGSCGGM